MNIQNGALALTGSACLEKVETLAFTGQQMEQIRAAGEAYRRLFNIRGTSPEWAPAYAQWQHLAENLAIAIVKHAEQLEVRQ